MKVVGERFRGGTGCGIAWRGRPALVLVGILGIFLLLESFLPLGSAVKIGADEDFELSKAILCMRGYRLYTEVWNDQPPLVTFVITKLLEHVSPSVLGPRLLTVAFGVVLLGSFFLLVQRVSGLMAAGIATVMLMGSPGFIELSSSCMQEILALAPVVVGLCILAYRERSMVPVAVAGLVLGFGFQMKLIGVVYLPVAALILWLQRQQEPGALKRTAVAGLLLGSCVLAAFVGLNYLTGNPLQVQLQQSWAAHFSSARSFEYGAPSDRPFDWMVLLRNWDTTIPAAVGAVFLVRQLFKRRSGEEQQVGSLLCWVPLAWVGLTLVVFPLHKPWWTYYYVHNAVPLCWCAAVGIVAAWDWVRAREARPPAKTAQRKKGSRASGELSASAWLSRVSVAGFTLSVAAWVGGRVYLQEASIRALPKLDSCLVLKEIEGFKPLTTFLFAHDPIFSFHSGVPMPPRLAMLSLKRLWSGEMTNARLVAEMEEVKPGLVLLANDAKEVIYQDLLNREYRLVYYDTDYRLFAHQSMSRRGR